MQTESMEKSQLRRLAARSGAALDRHPALFVLVLAFAVTLAVEMASRHSLWQGIVFLFAHPIHIAANTAIVLTTLAIGVFFKNRCFLSPSLPLADSAHYRGDRAGRGGAGDYIC